MPAKRTPWTTSVLPSPSRRPTCSSRPFRSRRTVRSPTCWRRARSARRSGAGRRRAARWWCGARREDRCAGHRAADGAGGAKARPVRQPRPVRHPRRSGVDAAPGPTGAAPAPSARGVGWGRGTTPGWTVDATRRVPWYRHRVLAEQRAVDAARAQGSARPPAEVSNSCTRVRCALSAIATSGAAWALAHGRVQVSATTTASWPRRCGHRSSRGSCHSRRRLRRPSGRRRRSAGRTSASRACRARRTPWARRRGRSRGGCRSRRSRPPG